RGGDEVYGESIYTIRYEFLGQYQLPFSEKVLFNFSYTDRDQNSVCADLQDLAKPRTGLGQVPWVEKLGKHVPRLGAAGRCNYYDENTTATSEDEINKPDAVFIPSIFIQNEYKFNERHTFLAGVRDDYDFRHGNILTPRIAYRWKISDEDIFRLNAGTGFRVVNLFTDEHAALTGSREVVIEEELRPEQSFNINLNYLKKLYLNSGAIIQFETAAWYTYFTNAILPDYDTNPNQIIYDNLDGYATSKGFSFNADANFSNRFKALLGFTFQDVSQTENGTDTEQILTEKYSGTWAFTYRIF